MSLLPVPLSTWQKALQCKPDCTVAKEIIAEYFSFFGLQKAKEELWLLTAATLTNEEVEQCKTANARADLLFYYEVTKRCMEAVCLVHSSGGQKGSAGAAAPGAGNCNEQ